MSKKRQVPECEIVSGLLSSVDYQELIKRQASTVVGTVEVKNTSGVKTKVYSNKKLRRK